VPDSRRLICDEIKIQSNESSVDMGLHLEILLMLCCALPPVVASKLTLRNPVSPALQCSFKTISTKYIDNLQPVTDRFRAVSPPFPNVLQQAVLPLLARDEILLWQTFYPSIHPVTLILHW